MILLSHLVPITLTDKMIPVSVERVNHIPSPVSFARGPHQAELPQRFNLDEAAKEVLQFLTGVYGGRIHAPHWCDLPLISQCTRIGALDTSEDSLRMEERHSVGFVWATVAKAKKNRFS